jgi:hypothetical protein
MAGWSNPIDDEYGDFGDDAMRDPSIKAFYTGKGGPADPRMVGVAVVVLAGLIAWKFA